MRLAPHCFVDLLARYLPKLNITFQDFSNPIPSDQRTNTSDIEARTQIVHRYMPNILYRHTRRLKQWSNFSRNACRQRIVAYIIHSRFHCTMHVLILWLVVKRNKVMHFVFDKLWDYYVYWCFVSYGTHTFSVSGSPDLPCKDNHSVSSETEMCHGFCVWRK